MMMMLVFISLMLLITLYSCNGHSSSNLNIANSISKSSSSNNSNRNHIVSTIAAATKPTTKLSSEANSKKNSIVGFIISNWFILSEIIVVIISKRHPSFFKSGGPLKPEFFVSKVGIFIIFLLNGMSISLDQIQNASANWSLNLLTQVFSMGLIPLVTYLLTSQFVSNQSIRDGIIALSVLPCTINMCVTLTQSAGGSAAAAIFNAVFGNFLGIFVSPLLILLILGTKTDFNFIPTVQKLAELVLLPVFTGQILRLTPVKKFMDKQKLITKTFGELILIAIVFNTFSDSFSRGIGTEMTLELKSLFVILPATYLVFNAIFWAVAHFLFPNVDVRTHAAAMICSSQKTLAFGLPFIKTAFSTRSDLSTILTPLLIFSPTQLFCATTILVPFLKREIAKADIDPVSYYPRKKMHFDRVSRDWGLRHKLKTVLTTICLLSVFFELCDEMMRDVPFLKDWVQHISYFGKNVRLPSLHHGVLLLSASHAIHATEEVYNHYKNQYETTKKADLARKILQISSNRYDSEIEAARAYDQVALIKYGPAAHINFKESVIPSQKITSRFRGIEWDDNYKAWRISQTIIEN